MLAVWRVSRSGVTENENLAPSTGPDSFSTVPLVSWARAARSVITAVSSEALVASPDLRWANSAHS
jgi:hypothetical protein